MWIAEQGRRRPPAEGTALVGRVTLPGDPAAVYLDGERRELPVYAPGGYVWRPTRDQQVLVLKTGAAGEAPCVAGTPCGEEREVAPGEVLIYSGGATVRLSGGAVTISGGSVSLNGQVLVNGRPVMTM